MIFVISLVKFRLFWVVESSKYSFWRFWCLFCDWTGAEIGKCLGRGYSSCRPKKKEKWMREKSSSAHADLDALNTPLLTFWKETRWWLTHPWINWLIIKYYEYSNLRFCIFTITSTMFYTIPGSTDQTLHSDNKKSWFSGFLGIRVLPSHKSPHQQFFARKVGLFSLSDMIRPS